MTGRLDARQRCSREEVAQVEGLPIVFGVIEIAGGKLGMRHVDCETGEVWHP
ncbi:MAG: hypothetical protein K8H88_11955 [Sandaracinaceae bacterium]|nr:hypothetical protein [Sandaracinaceae bacterium]